MQRIENPALRRGLRIAGVVLALIALFFVYQVVQSIAALNRASTQVAVLEQHIARGDVDAARVTLERLQSVTDRARRNSDGPIWAVAGAVPWLGRNAEAITTISAVLDEIVDDALPPVVDIAEQVRADAFTPRDGKVDIEALTQIQPTLEEARRLLDGASQQLEDIEPERLLGRLRRPVSAVRLKIDFAAEAAEAASTSARLLPTMLGGEGKRRYLLLVQSNAEIRSLGGIPGSWAVLEAEDGRVTMTQQGGTSDILPFDKPVSAMTDEEKSVFGDVMVTDFRNTVLTPDFPRAAELASAMLKQRQDISVDGVISVDPVAMSYLLGGTGPVTVDRIDLTTTNAVFLLLNQSYALIPGGEPQDEFFQSVARAVFDAVKDGRGDPQGVLRGIVRGVRENRILVWSTQESEQSLIAGTGVAGALAGDDGAVPHVGLYINDATETKLQYYLDYSTRVRATECRDGVQTLTTSTVVSSAAPQDAADFPERLIGNGSRAPKGAMRINLRFYGPYRGAVTSVTVDGEEQTRYVASHHGRPVQFVTLVLNPGDRFQVTTTMVTGEGQTGDGVFSTTPGVAPTPNDVRVPSAC